MALIQHEAEECYEKSKCLKDKFQLISSTYFKTCKANLKKVKIADSLVYNSF
jgi:hypothetical protein